MQIPDTARDFIDTLRPILKPSTCTNHGYDLGGFHTWIDQQHIKLCDIDRGAMERWLKSLADRGLLPSTRCVKICHVRKYLGWLFEQDKISVHPYDLLRPSDFPKIPSLLPKPFPKEADRELQRRFWASNTIYGQALFLMRRSGIRIGELTRLEPGCLEKDIHDNAFLKVPLGKLDNERLVPLDSETRQILEKLQQGCQSNASFLLAPHLRRRTVRNHLRYSLKEISIDIDASGPIIPHRLRHTYATELLNAGMSLFTIMKLLGHRSIKMTMRYASITQETIVADYHRAIAEITTKYTLPTQHPNTTEPDPERLLLDTISWLRNNSTKNNNTSRLIKRIYRIQSEIAQLKNNSAK